MLKKSFAARRGVVLPPRRIVSDSPDELNGPYFKQASYSWGDPILEKMSDYLGRAVRLQRRIMEKAGVSDPYACNQVEIEMRLGQLASRRVSDKNSGDSSGATANKGKKEGGGQNRGLRQVQTIEPLLSLPVATPAVIDENMCSFRSGFKVMGRCGGFFTVPTRVNDSLTTSEFCEVANHFADHRTYDMEVSRVASAMERTRAYDDGEEMESLTSRATSDGDLTDEERSIISKHQRFQSSIESEVALTSNAAKQKGFVDGSPSSITLGVVDIHGSDQLPLPPVSWVRMIDTASPATADGKPCVYKSSESDSTRYECQVFTSDGLRLEFYNGIVVSSGPRKLKAELIKDKIRIDLMVRTKERRKAFTQYLDTKTSNNVQSTLAVTPTGMKDVVIDCEYPVELAKTKGDSPFYATVPHMLAFRDSRVIRKANVAHSNLRMPHWAGDARLSVSIERTANDDGTPFDLEVSRLFGKEIEVALYDTLIKETKEGSPERAKLEERASREINLIRFRKRCEYRLMDLQVGCFNDHRRHRISCVKKWFGMFDSTESSCELKNVDDGTIATIARDPISDNFLRLFVSDVIVSESHHSRDSLTTSELRSWSPGEIFVSRPSADDSRLREIEVEVNMPNLTNAVLKREAALSDAIDEVRRNSSLSDDEREKQIRYLNAEAQYQLSELFAVVSMRMFDALGSFSRVP